MNTKPVALADLRGWRFAALMLSGASGWTLVGFLLWWLWSQR
jgi:hypothetical protein